MSLCRFPIPQSWNGDQSCQECRKVIGIAKRKMSNRIVREGNELRQWVGHVNTLDIVLPLCEILDRHVAEQIIKAGAESSSNYIPTTGCAEGSITSLKHEDMPDLQPYLDFQPLTKVSTSSEPCTVVVMEVDDLDD